jgi:hypothetical protein
MLPLEAKQAKALADEANAANPAKAMEVTEKAIKSAARKGLYSDWVVLREVDAEAILPILSVLGYHTQVQPAEQGKKLVQITWA